MSAVPPVRTVVMGFDARPTDATDDLFGLVRVLLAAGAAPHVLLIGDGERLAELRALVPVTVVNDFRWRGLAVATSLARADRWTRGLKARHLRRWLRRRSDQAWIVHDPTATAPLRHAERLPDVLVACLPDGRSPGDLAPLDRASLAGASLWLVDDAAQASELARLGAEVLVLEHDDLGAEDHVDPGDPATWPVLLVPTPDAWDAINHTDEVARHLAVHHPEVPVVWLASDGQDRWLAAHDIRANGLGATVTCATREELHDRLLRAVVRTGYGPAHHDVVAHAEDAHVPALGLCSPGEAPTPDRVPPLAVDQLLERLDQVLTDPAALDTVRSQLQEHEDRRARILAARVRLRERLEGAPAG